MSNLIDTIKRSYAFIVDRYLKENDHTQIKELVSELLEKTITLSDENKYLLDRISALSDKNASLEEILASLEKNLMSNEDSATDSP